MRPTTTHLTIQRTVEKSDQYAEKIVPKLAICTYHLPDDPQVLEQIIKEANPAYEVRYLRHKLMACVPNN